MDKQKIYIILVLLIFLGALYYFQKTGAVYEREAHDDFDNRQQISDKTRETETSERVIIQKNANTAGQFSLSVGITGGVNKPGIYKFNNKPTIRDVITAAGGLTNNAIYADKYDNIEISRQDTIIIPVKIKYEEYQNKYVLTNQIFGNLDKFEKELEITEKTVKSTAPFQKVNINSNDINELIRLPRIGPKTAETIIEYRRQRGDFRKISDITGVPRIGQKTYELIKDKIFVK